MAHDFAEDTFDEEPPRRRYGMVTTLVVVIVFAAFGGGLWYAYKEGLRQGSESVAPVIAADDGPIKVRPQTPGGMEVPYRDTLVYGKLTPGPVKEAEAQLQPAPEEPIITRRPKPRPGAEVAGPASPTAPPPIFERPVDSAAAPPADPAPPPAEPAAQPSPQPAAQPTPAPDVPPSPSARYRLQLASMRSAEAATETWDALSAKHGDVIGGLELVIQKIDLGEGKGIYYRVQAGPVTSEADGNQKCATLRQRKIACIVVRR
jgi:hypothetical protein